MPKYRFDLKIDDIIVSDGLKKDFPNDHSAIEEARASARELIAESIKHNAIVPATKLIVISEGELELLAIDLDISVLLKQLNRLPNLTKRKACLSSIPYTQKQQS